MKLTELKKGEKVWDAVHEAEGVVVDIVQGAEDGHHGAFVVVERSIADKTGKTRKYRAHLTEKQIDKP